MRASRECLQSGQGSHTEVFQLDRQGTLQLGGQIASVQSQGLDWVPQLVLAEQGLGRWVSEQHLLLEQ